MNYDNDHYCRRALIQIVNENVMKNSILLLKNDHQPSKIPVGEQPTLDEFLELVLTVGGTKYKFENEDKCLYIFKQIMNWQSDARLAIEGNLSSVLMEGVIKRGESFGIILPEMKSLKTSLDRLKWSEELQSLYSSRRYPLLDELKAHYEKGLSLPESSTILKDELQEVELLIKKIESWEDRAEELIKSEVKPTSEKIEELLKESNEIKAFLPSKKLLEDIMRKARDWMTRVATASGLKNGPYVDVYEDLLLKGKVIKMELGQIEQIEIQLDLVRMWKEKVGRIFLKNNSPITLMEALAPRKEVGVKTTKKKKTAETAKKFVFGVKLGGETDPGVVVAAFKRAEKHEYELISQLRTENVMKKVVKDAKYCICRKPAAGFMMECSLCKEKFHGSCIPMGIESNNSSTDLADTKFLCPVCVRTKRPKLDVLIELVQSMQMIRVRIPEGEALQRLTERAMNWQDRARKLLNSDEMSYRSMSQQSVNTERHSKLMSMMLRLQSLGDERSSSTITSASTSTSQASTSEHAYSTVSRSVPTKKHMRKSPLIPRVLEEPSRITEYVFKQLKELMIQGDLMEVFVEETTYIWKLLQTYKQQHYGIWDESFEEFIPKDQINPEPQSKSVSKVEKPVSKKRNLKDDGKNATPAKTTKKVDDGNLAKRKNAKVENKPKTKPKKARVSNPSSRSKKSKVRNKDDEEEDPCDSSEDDCAAEPCKRPTGSALHWVQCDGGCDLWFHLLCIGLHKSDINEDEDYVCEKCK